MKKLISICLLMFCYISLSATKGCQEDYVLFEESATPTPTATATYTATPEEDVTTTITPTPTLDDEDLGNEDEGDVSDLATDVKKSYFINNNDNAQNDNNQDDNDGDDEGEEDLKANIDMNDFLEDLEGLSQDSEDLTWLGNAFSNKDKEQSNSKEDADEIDNEFLDTDNDGYSDVLELEMDSNPNEPTSFPVINKTRLHDRVDALAITEAQNSQSPKDSDNDGLSDDLEAVLGTNQLSKDTDSDGISDFREFENGTDPMISDL